MARLPERFWHPTPEVEDGQMTGLQRYLADIDSWLRHELSLADAVAPRLRGVGAPPTFEVLNALGIPPKRMVLDRPERHTRDEQKDSAMNTPGAMPRTTSARLRVNAQDGSLFAHRDLEVCRVLEHRRTGFEPFVVSSVGYEVE